MPFEIKKPFVPKKTFIINRNLHLNAEGKVVEENDPTGVRNLGSTGKAFYEAEAKHYGLDDSHRLVEDKPAEPAPVEPPPVETQAEPEEEEPAVEPEELKGRLPEDFPGHAALEAAGINTYGQLRKAIAKGTPEQPWYTEITNVADKTAEKIEDALVAVPEE